MATAGAASLAGESSAIADRIGQETYDARNLPLVCLDISTLNRAMPLQSVTMENRDSHRLIRFYLRESPERADPSLLTALGKGNQSLSLIILRFRPGRYVIRQAEFLSSRGMHTTTLMSFDISSDQHAVWFEAKPGCVNYVGGISISANWDATVLSSNPNQHLHAASFSHQDSVTPTMARDAKWACDLNPCMRSLPFQISPLRVD